MAKLILALVLGISGLASAQVLDFEDVPPSSSTVPSVITRGYQLLCSDYLYVASGPGYCLPDCPGGSGHFVISQSGIVPLTLSRLDGGTFSLLSFSFAEHNIGILFSPQIVVEGTLADASVVSYTVTLDGINDGSGPLIDFQTASLPPSFSNLTSVSFRGVNQYFYSLDNIVVTVSPAAVPVLSPGHLALLILAFAAAGTIALSGIRTA